MKARLTSTSGGKTDSFSEAHGWLARETEETAEWLSARATESTEPGDKDLQFCDDALGLMTAHSRHMADRRASLTSMEGAYRHGSNLAIQAISNRFKNMVAIFKKQKEQLDKYEKVLKAERRKTSEANSQTERLKSLLAEQAKDLKRAKASSTSLSNTIVNKNQKLKKWQHSYKLLELEVADLHSERLERASEDPERMAEADVIRVHPHEPPPILPRMRRMMMRIRGKRFLLLHLSKCLLLNSPAG